jgi:hypothetical protein
MAYDQNIVLAAYKKLLTLYPPGFRKQLGESMEQTFNDLCNERKQQPEGGLFGFVLWTFVETAIGIVQEHSLFIKEMNPMKNILTNLRSPAIISFLIILPFMFLEFMFVIVKRLNTFSLRNALDFLVLFGFLWLGLASILLILMPIVRNIRAGNHLMASPGLPKGNAMTNLITNPKSAAIIGFILALPFVTLLSLLLLNIEPPLGPLEPLLNNPNPDQPDVLGSLIALGAFLLAVLACLIARAPILRTMQAGGGLFAHPMNLILAVVILFFVTRLVGGIIVDQYPCFIGVSNCD